MKAGVPKLDARVIIPRGYHKPKSIADARRQVELVQDEVLGLGFQLSANGRRCLRQSGALDGSHLPDNHLEQLGRLQDWSAYLVAYIEAGGENPGREVIRTKRRLMDKQFRESELYDPILECGLDSPLLQYFKATTVSEAQERDKLLKSAEQKVKTALAAIPRSCNWETAEGQMLGAKRRYLTTLHHRILDNRRRYQERIKELCKPKPLPKRAVLEGSIGWLHV